MVVVWKELHKILSMYLSKDKYEKYIIVFDNSDIESDIEYEYEETFGAFINLDLRAKIILLIKLSRMSVIISVNITKLLQNYDILKFKLFFIIIIKRCS